MKTLDGQLDKLDGVAAVAIWLGDKAFDKHKEYLPRINKSLSFEKTHWPRSMARRAVRRVGHQSGCSHHRRSGQ